MFFSRFIAFILFGLWVLATSFRLMQRIGAPRPMKEMSATG